VAAGIPEAQVIAFVNSFQGQIYMRTALVGETFGVYSGGLSNPASGQFLTPGTAGQTPAQVINTLALPPTNPATSLNAATITRPIPVLEGVVAPQQWSGSTTLSGSGWQILVPGGAVYGVNPPVSIGNSLQ
jgi:filamentous hemagglutinin